MAQQELQQQQQQQQQQRRQAAAADGAKAAKPARVPPAATPSPAVQRRLFEQPDGGKHGDDSNSALSPHSAYVERWLSDMEAVVHSSRSPAASKLLACGLPPPAFVLLGVLPS